MFIHSSPTVASFPLSSSGSCSFISPSSSSTISLPAAGVLSPRFTIGVSGRAAASSASATPSSSRPSQRQSINRVATAASREIDIYSNSAAASSSPATAAAPMNATAASSIVCIRPDRSPFASPTRLNKQSLHSINFSSSTSATAAFAPTVSSSNSNVPGVFTYDPLSRGSFVGSSSISKGSARIVETTTAATTQLFKGSHSQPLSPAVAVSVGQKRRSSMPSNIGQSAMSVAAASTAVSCIMQHAPSLEQIRQSSGGSDKSIGAASLPLASSSMSTLSLAQFCSQHGIESDCAYASLAGPPSDSVTDGTEKGQPHYGRIVPLRETYFIVEEFSPLTAYEQERSWNYIKPPCMEADKQQMCKKMMAKLFAPPSASDPPDSLAHALQVFRTFSPCRARTLLSGKPHPLVPHCTISTILHKLDTGGYETVEAFVAEVNTFWSNCHREIKNDGKKLYEQLCGQINNIELEQQREI